MLLGFAASTPSLTNPRIQNWMEAFEPYAQRPKRGMADAWSCVPAPLFINIPTLADLRASP
jgi:hypothetical protein